MVKLGKFEEINSNLKGQTGIVVKNRKKKEVEIYEDGMGEIAKVVSFKIKKNSFWNRLKMKIRRRTHNKV